MTRDWSFATVIVLLVSLAFRPGTVAAQQAAADPDSRAAEIAARQAEKARTAHPYEPNAAEGFVEKLDQHLRSGHVSWHPYVATAYSGAGFTLGAGYTKFIGDYSTVDARGSMSLSGSKRLEVEAVFPRLLERRGVLKIGTGWREGLDAPFYGIGNDTLASSEANFDFRQYNTWTELQVRPRRTPFLFGGTIEYMQIDQRFDLDTVFAQLFTPDKVPGVGAEPDYIHASGTVALDWRPAADYARRGGYYGITAQHYADQKGEFTFTRMEYEAVQHVPILRDAWVLSLRGRVHTTLQDDVDAVPFFLMPFLGSGSTLRGYSSGRFRDLNTLLLSAEWRVLVNSFVDVAFFYDAGKVTPRPSDLNFEALHDNYGVGLRLHSAIATPIRVEFARGKEGNRLVFAADAVF
jgi:Omp85 superfamily domain